MKEKVLYIHLRMFCLYIVYWDVIEPWSSECDDVIFFHDQQFHFLFIPKFIDFFFRSLTVRIREN